ncbi:MAG: iron ABC transporter permease [Deltaproteobacteria bacterium]|nr:iron ABC transporter permease [Deltaproteobacteria bacterium]
MVTYKKLISVLGLLTLILLGACAMGLGWGSVRIPVFQGLVGAGLDSTSRAILWDLRLPRVLLAGIVGWSLSIGGVVFQALMRNPLAEPFLLGISSGAALGAVAGIIFGVLFWGGIPTMAFLGALITITLVLAIAQKAQSIEANTLILTGVIVNAFFAALIMFALATTSGEKLHTLLFWLYGDLSRGRFSDLWAMIPVILSVSFVLYGMARSFNLIASGEEVASQLGLAVERTKWISLILVSFMCGITVAFSGIIGFVGLIVPHLVRMAFGPDHRLLLPASGLFGASFLIGADLLARVLISPSELPVGVITAFLGAPFFLTLLYLRRRSWSP